MLDVLMFLLAMAAGGGEGAMVASKEAGDTGGAAESVAAAAPSSAPVVAHEAEDQTPSGKFLRATEVKPILTATKGNWVAVREFNGQDLVYFTHLLSWRCGLHEFRFSINGGPMQIWPMPQCYADGPSPNAIKTEDGLPYVAYALGSVETIDVEILYDDLTTDGASFDRKSVLMP